MTVTKSSVARFPESFVPFANLQGVPFILVPLRQRADGATVIGTAAKPVVAVDAPGKAASRPATPRATAPYGYRVKNVRRRLDGLTAARTDVYKALLKAKRPMTVREAALAAKHPKETTQQLLVALVEAGYAVRAPIKTIRTPERPAANIIRTPKAATKTIRTPLGAAGGRRQAAGGAARRAGAQAADRPRR